MRLPVPHTTPPQLPASLSAFIAIDEGRNRLLRFSPSSPKKEWAVTLTGKSRALQLLPNNRILMVADTGFREIDAGTGETISETRCCDTGVISAVRLDSGNTFLGGLNLFETTGVTFAELDSSANMVRRVTFPGDYVRRSSLTEDDTILFTCDSRVFEGDWTGKILGEFSAPGFRHAWKPIRTAQGTTIISAGYGAFVAEFDLKGRAIRRWECRQYIDSVRPHFFGDFEPLPSGGLLVCNWLGHGDKLGASGCALVEFSAEGEVLSAWQDARRTSSLQTFVLLDD